MQTTHRENAQHYVWGDGCDGWVLAPGPDLLVIEERMPAGAAEVPHHHERARQFFFVLSGTLTMRTASGDLEIAAGQGVEVPPGLMHEARNDTDADVRFLVSSAPTTRGDRVDLPVVR